MDTVTQIALGAAVGEATLGRKVGWRAPLWGGHCGLLPDLDVLWPFADPVSAFTWHRGYTHALAVLVLAAPVVAWAAVRFHPATRPFRRGWLVLSRERGLGHRLNHAGLALGVAWLVLTLVIKAHVDRVAGDSLPAGVTRLPHHAVAVQRGALASGRDDRRRAVSRGLLLAAGLGAAGVVREPGGRPRAARTASQRSGGGARHLVFPGILQRPGARERRDRDLRPSDGIRRAARVLVRGGPPRGGCDRTRAASSRTR